MEFIDHISLWFARCRYEPHLSLLTEVGRAKEMALRIAQIPDLSSKEKQPGSTVKAESIIE